MQLPVIDCSDLTGNRTGYHRNGPTSVDLTAKFDANDREVSEADRAAGTFTAYGYGTSNLGTDQTSKAVYEGTDDIGTLASRTTYAYDVTGQDDRRDVR